MYMNDYALILAGGGAKGAYQIGVWKALRDLGADKLISAVAGTSVGALNGSLYVSGEYKKALGLWRNLRRDDVLTPSQLEHRIDGNDILTSLLKNNLLSRIKTGIFSRSGLSGLISENLNFRAVRRSDTPLYITLFDIKRLSAEYVRLSPDDSDERIKSLLLASSAIPVVFPPEIIGGRSYYDGGIADNCPVKPLYTEGYRKFVVVWLSHDSSDGIREHSAKFSDATFVNIVPSEDQGNFITGTLDFSEDGINARIELGYNDAVNALCNAFCDEASASSEKRISYAKRSIRKISKSKQ